MNELALLVIATMATDEPDTDDQGSRSARCRRCGDTFTILDGLDPCALCNDCAHNTTQELGEAFLRLYAHLKTLPVIVAEPIRYAIEDARSEDPQAFIHKVIAHTTRHVFDPPKIGKRFEPPKIGARIGRRRRK